MRNRLLGRGRRLTTAVGLSLLPALLAGLLSAAPAVADIPAQQQP